MFGCEDPTDGMDDEDLERCYFDTYQECQIKDGGGLKTRSALCHLEQELRDRGIDPYEVVQKRRPRPA